MKALRKPTVSAWAVNQLARRHPAEVRGLVRAADALRKAQRAAVSGRDSAALRDAQRVHRGAIDDLSLIARHELGVDGATAQRVAQTLRAASIDRDAAKAFLAGTLSGDVEQVGFGPMLGLVPSSPSSAARPTRSAGRAGAKPPRNGKRAPKARPEPPPKPLPKPKPAPRVKQRARVEAQLEKARARVNELEGRLQELDRR